MEWLKHSTTSRKIYGEIESPCLMPLEGFKVWEGETLTKMENKPLEMRYISQDIHFS